MRGDADRAAARAVIERLRYEQRRKTTVTLYPEEHDEEAATLAAWVYAYCRDHARKTRGRLEVRGIAPAFRALDLDLDLKQIQPLSNAVLRNLLDAGLLRRTSTSPQSPQYEVVVGDDGGHAYERAARNGAPHVPGATPGPGRAEPGPDVEARPRSSTDGPGSLPAVRHIRTADGEIPRSAIPAFGDYLEVVALSKGPLGVQLALRMPDGAVTNAWILAREWAANREGTS